MKVKVKPEDTLELTIELRGVIGADLATVAGREQARAKLVEAATKQVDDWLDDTVVEER